MPWFLWLIGGLVIGYFLGYAAGTNKGTARTGAPKV